MVIWTSVVSVFWWKSGRRKQSDLSNEILSWLEVWITFILSFHNSVTWVSFYITLFIYIYKRNSQRRDVRDVKPFSNCYFLSTLMGFRYPFWSLMVVDDYVGRTRFVHFMVNEVYVLMTDSLIQLSSETGLLGDRVHRYRLDESKRVVLLFE